MSVGERTCGVLCQLSDRGLVTQPLCLPTRHVAPPSEE